MIPSTLRRRVLLLYLGYRVGELVQIGAEGVEEAQDGVPADPPSATLDLRDVGRMDAEPDGHLLLSYTGLIAQRLERPAEHNLISSSVTHLSGFSQVAISSGSPNIVPPHRCHGRGRGTEDQGLRRAGHDIRSGDRGSLARAPVFGASYQGGTDMTTLTIPANVVGIVRSALHSELGQAASEIAAVSEERERYPERYDEPVAHFDAYRALLEAIGWGDTERPEPVQMDIAQQHQRELLTALEARLEIERDYMAVSPHLKGAERQRRTATRYARTIEGFLPTVRARVKQIGGQ
jgi:hypothetical protein